MTWDEIYERAENCGFASSELKVKDEARFQVGQFVLNKEGYDLETAEIPEEKIEYYCALYNIVFDEYGNIKNEEELKMTKNNWPYGKEMLEDEIISSLSDWSDEKEYVLGTMDQVYDYRWDIRDDGKVVFTDNLCAEQEINPSAKLDETAEARRADGTDILTFNSLADAAAWLKERETA